MTSTGEHARSEVVAAPVVSVRSGRRRPRIEGVWYLLVVLLLTGYLINSSFLSATNLNSVLVSTVPLVILATGQTLVLVGREIDLSVGSIVGLTAVICGRFMDHEAGLIVPVALLAISVGALIGVINGLITVRLGVPSFVVTLGMLLIVRGVINVWTGGAPSSNIPRELTSWLTGSKLVGFATGAVLVLIVVTATGYVLAHRTKFGRYLFLTGGGPAAARLAGLPAERTVVLSFVLSGAFAGVAGVYLAAWTGSVRGDLGTGMELVAIAAAVLGGVALSGGRGQVLSAAAGALCLGIILNLLIVAGLPIEAQNVGKGLIIIASVLAYSTLRRLFAGWHSQRSRVRTEKPVSTTLRK